MARIILSSLIFIFVAIFSFKAMTGPDKRYVIEVYAPDSDARSKVEEAGASIINIDGDHVYAIGGEDERRILQKKGWLRHTHEFSVLDFPKRDADFHNYDELTLKLEELSKKYPDLTELKSIGKTHEGREIWAMELSDKSSSAIKAPILFMGGHHAREHLSVEMPILLIEHLLKEYKRGNADIKYYLEQRTIHVVPMVNPDGAEHDISANSYKYWRKNRRVNGDGTYGVDLNRNYGYQWGTGGSSSRTSADTYKGPTQFSEPESRAIRDYVRGIKDLKILTSFHTFSELILYPWGHKKDEISSTYDLEVHKTMAQTMSQWNGYKPMQASSLYVASGDTMDWAYGELGIFSFTFELDPKGRSAGGFYPGAAAIQRVFKKNIQPCLYLIDYADNPYRVLPR